MSVRSRSSRGGRRAVSQTTAKCARHDSNMRPLPPHGTPCDAARWRRMSKLGSSKGFARLPPVRVQVLPEALFEALGHLLDILFTPVLTRLADVSPQVA